MKTNGIAYRIAAYTLAAIGLVAFFFLMGDEAPEYPLTLGEFALIKCGALAVLALVLFAAQRLYKKMEDGQ